MKLSARARAALVNVIAKFKAGDLSPVVEIARIKRQGDPIPGDRWSLSNRILAYIQTGSLDCRGYRQWQQTGRQVKKGAQSAYILGPCLVRVTDKETGEKRHELRGFGAIPVFAYHDTDGEPLPEYDYTPRELPPLAEVAERLGVDLQYVPLPPDRLGDCDVTGEHIRLGSHDPSVFFHELAHAAHAKLNGKLTGGQNVQQETIAEFTAAVLTQLYGLGDRSGNAWRYIKSYAKDPLQAIIKALNTIEQVLVLLEAA
jgi:hypothetical protein